MPISGSCLNVPTTARTCRARWMDPIARTIGRKVDSATWAMKARVARQASVGADADSFLWVLGTCCARQCRAKMAA